jgi:hypothetical protein
MLAFGAAPLDVGARIGLIRRFAGTLGCRLEPQFANAGSFELLIDLATGLGFEVPGFSGDRFGDPFTQLPGSELAVRVRQLKPPRPRGIEPPCRGHGGDAASQPDLFGDAATDRIRVHIGGKLFSDLGLSEPHRLGRLQCGGNCPQLLQPSNPINPSHIRGACAVGDNRGQLVQDLIETAHHGIRRWRLCLEVLES